MQLLTPQLSIMFSDSEGNHNVIESMTLNRPDLNYSRGELDIVIEAWLSITLVLSSPQRRESNGVLKSRTLYIFLDFLYYISISSP